MATGLCFLESLPTRSQRFLDDYPLKTYVSGSAQNHEMTLRTFDCVNSNHCSSSHSKQLNLLTYKPSLVVFFPLADLCVKDFCDFIAGFFKT